MAVRTEQVGEMTVVALRHVGPYDQISHEFGELMNWTNKHKVAYDLCLAVYHDDLRVVSSQELRSDACVVVADDFSLPSSDGLDLRLDTVPSGEYAVTTHVGAYDGLGNAWESFVAEEILALGRIPDHQVAFEIYRVAGPGIAPSEQRTDLYMRLR